MKGITKAFARTPHMLTTKVGMSKKSSDPEFDDYARRFASIETGTDKLLKDTKAFTEAVSNLFTHGVNFSEHFATLFHPIAGEYDLIGKHPNAANTIRNVDAHEAAFQELKAAVVPELELIESRIVGPVKELQGIMKMIRKSITKREHKLIDYDRYNNSLTKLRDKKEKSLNDEKHIFKLEQDFEIASNEYDYINTAMKNDMPRFLVMATQFIDPLFHSFFYMQLNIFYMLLEKLSGFAEGKYDVSITGAQIASDYEEKRTDAMEQIEALSISQRLISTSKLVQSRRLAAGNSPPSMSRPISSTHSISSAASGASRLPPPVRSPSSSAPAYAKKAPPPPSPSLSPVPPPPYSSTPMAGVGIAKKAPPPPPPLKPKPKPAASYVVALYDFSAQADGDLDFRAGDRIEVVERTESAEDWWTGRIGDRQGVFPGNYVQEA